MTIERGTFVLVTTTHKGVFFGVLKKSKAPEYVELTDVQNVIRWRQEGRGFLGLAVTGPTDGCTVGPAAEEANIYGVTGVIRCSTKAVAAFKAKL